MRKFGGVPCFLFSTLVAIAGVFPITSRDIPVSGCISSGIFGIRAYESCCFAERPHEIYFAGRFHFHRVRLVVFDKFQVESVNLE